VNRTSYGTNAQSKGREPFLLTLPFSFSKSWEKISIKVAFCKARWLADSISLFPVPEKVEKVALFQVPAWKPKKTQNLDLRNDDIKTYSPNPGFLWQVATYEGLGLTLGLGYILEQTKDGHGISWVVDPALLNLNDFS